MNSNFVRIYFFDPGQVSDPKLKDGGIEEKVIKIVKIEINITWKIPIR
jgi:hypothetical protein